jgi:uncharacterized membrane protein YphA (DoxX/SURF4 family)
MNTLSRYTSVALRLGLACVFLWFAINQINHTSNWLGVVPAWAGSLFGGKMVVVYLNAWFELVCAIMLLVGLQVRWIGLILCLHLIEIAAGFGLTAVGVRDYGLAFAALAIFLNGAGIWSLDAMFARKQAAGRTQTSAV